MAKPEKPRITIMLSPYTYDKFEKQREKDPLLPSISRFGETLLLRALEQMDCKTATAIHNN